MEGGCVGASSSYVGLYLLGLSLDLKPLALWDSLIFLLKVPKG